MDQEEEIRAKLLASLTRSARALKMGTRPLTGCDANARTSSLGANLALKQCIYPEK